MAPEDSLRNLLLPQSYTILILLSRNLLLPTNKPTPAQSILLHQRDPTGLPRETPPPIQLLYRLGVYFVTIIISTDRGPVRQCAPPATPEPQIMCGDDDDVVVEARMHFDGAMTIPASASTFYWNMTSLTCASCSTSTSLIAIRVWMQILRLGRPRHRHCHLLICLLKASSARHAQTDHLNRRMLSIRMLSIVDMVGGNNDIFPARGWMWIACRAGRGGSICIFRSKQIAIAR